MNVCSRRVYLLSCYEKYSKIAFDQGEVFGNSLVLGTMAEWSPAWPVKGIDTDWSVLLTSDFELEVVAAASLVGPAGTVPTGLTGVVEFAVSDIVGFLGADMSLFSHAINKIDIHVAHSKAFGFFMIGLNICNI